MKLFNINNLFKNNINRTISVKHYSDRKQNFSNHTPARTFLKKAFSFSLAVIIAFSNFTTVNASQEDAYWPEGPSVASESAILMDANTGTILYEKNSHEELYPASTTKIMTVLLALENLSLDEVVTFSANAVFSIERNSSHIGIDVDEQLTVEQCLYGIMLESANEVSNGIAEQVSGSIEEFANLMNEKASSLGCQNTHFSNANGLPDETHYTSAYDLALISRAALQNETFRTITSTPRYTIPPTNIQPETRYLVNHHKMSPIKEYPYEGWMGGKTGYTTVAKSTLVTFAKRGDLELICVVMKADSPDHYTDTATLFDWGFENFQILNISENESSYNIENNSFFDTDSRIFSNTDNLISINPNGVIVLPNTASFSDTTSTIAYDNTSDGTIANLTYSYGDKEIGSTTINITNTIVDEYEFKERTSTTSEENITPEEKEGSNHKSIIIKIVIGIVVAIVVILLIIGALYLFRNHHILKRRRIRKHRKDSRKFDDFDLDL